MMSIRLSVASLMAALGCCLLLVLAGCQGSSRDQIDSLENYAVSGRVISGDGTGMAGVQLTLGAYSAMTAADGSFIFPAVPRGYTGTLVPSHGDRMFIPASLSVALSNRDLELADIKCFDVAGMTDDLPQAGREYQLVTLTLRAVDAGDNPLAGFTTGPGLVTSTPSGVVVLTAPQFNNGVAVAVLRFDTAGTYTVALSGFCPMLDGELGTIAVAPGEPQQSIFHAETWYGGAKAAVSLTFDDGSADHWSRGMALWAEYGFQVTLGILADRFQAQPERLPQLQQAVDAGHELANHTTTHPDMTTLTPELAAAEIETCQRLVLDNVEGQERVVTFIYPYEQFNESVIALLKQHGYLFARSGAQDMIDVTSLNDALAPPLYNLYSWANLNTLPLEMWDDTVYSAMESGGWLVEQCHGIGADGETGVGWSPRPESEFRAHYDLLVSFGPQLWVAPVGEVGRYVVERNNAQFTITENTATRLGVQLTTGLDDAVYGVPLTVWLTKPSGWNSLSVKQGPALVPHTVAEDGRIRFNAAPGGALITLEKTS